MDFRNRLEALLLVLKSGNWTHVDSEACGLTPVLNHFESDQGKEENVDKKDSWTSTRLRYLNCELWSIHVNCVYDQRSKCILLQETGKEKAKQHKAEKGNFQMLQECVWMEPRLTVRPLSF